MDMITARLLIKHLSNVEFHMSYTQLKTMNSKAVFVSLSSADVKLRDETDLHYDAAAHQNSHLHEICLRCHAHDKSCVM